MTQPIPSPCLSPAPGKSTQSSSLLRGRGIRVLLLAPPGSPQNIAESTSTARMSVSDAGNCRGPLPVCLPAPGSPLPSSSLSIRASVPTVSSKPRLGVARPQSRSRVYTPSIVSCTPGLGGKTLPVPYAQLVPSCSPSLSLLLCSLFPSWTARVASLLPYPAST